MFKPYTNQADIPDEFKDHYSRREDGKYHADIPNDHPAVKHNAALLSEKTTAISERDEARTQLESAKASGLPRGHEAVLKADADLIRVVKQHGTAEEITAVLTAYPKLKADNEAAAREKHLGAVEKVMNWKPGVLSAIPGVPDLDIRDLTENGQVVKNADGTPKQTVVAKLKDAQNVITEKPFIDYFNATPALKIFEPALRLEEQRTGVTFPTQTFGQENEDISLAASFIKNRYGHNAQSATAS